MVELGFDNGGKFVLSRIFFVFNFFFDPKNYLSQKRIGENKFWTKKKIESKKNFWAKINFGPKKKFGRNFFGPNFLLGQKNL